MLEKRNSKIELLRIIAIVFIVLSHYVVHCGYNIHNLPFGLNRFMLEIGMLGNIGTMIFVLISGFYLINSKKTSIKKIVHFWLQVWFYSLFIYLVLVIVNKENFNLKSFMSNAFPISFERYWFATTYFVMYLFHQYINKFLNALSRKEHFRFIAVATFLFYIISTLTTMNFYASELIYFLILYSIGAYLSKYNHNSLVKNNNYFKVMLVSFLFIVLSIIVFDLIGNKYYFIGNHSTYFLNNNSILALLLSVSTFYWFSRMKPCTNNAINYLSSLVFGVYLISDNKYLRSIIWQELLKNSTYFTSNYLILHIIGSICIVCIVCLFIEFMRKVVFNYAIYKWLDKLLEKKQKIIDNYILKE